MGGGGGGGVSTALPDSTLIFEAYFLVRLKIILMALHSVGLAN